MTSRYFPSRIAARAALRRSHLEQFGATGVREHEPRRLNAKLRRRKQRRQHGGRR